MDYSHIVAFSFNWAGGRAAAKLALLSWLCAAAFAALLAAIALALFGELLFALWSGSTAALAFLLLDPGLVGEMVSGFLFAALPACVAFLFAFLLVHALMLLLALRKAGFAPPPLSRGKAARLVLLSLANAFFSFFPFFRPRLLVPLAAAFLLAALTFVPHDGLAVFSGFAALALFLFHLLVVLYNVVRQSQACPVFLDGEKGVVESVLESRKITGKRFWEVLSAYLAVCLVFFPIFALAFFFLSMAFTAFASALLLVFSAAFQLSVAVSFFLLLPFALLVHAFCLAGVYSQLTLGEKRAGK